MITNNINNRFVSLEYCNKIVTNYSLICANIYTKGIMNTSKKERTGDELYF